MRKMPLGIQSFRKIIEGDYVYVDKTKFVYDLMNDASYYFLSRPRRFGKSLLLDTIAEVMSGEKDLFKGLSIHDSDYQFEKHPVIRLDMSNVANETPSVLKDSLSKALLRQAKREGLCIDYDMPPELFINMIEGLHEKCGKKVVILIDEYDKPILDRLADIETAEANRDILRGFYGILKSMDPYLRFTFVTGVSKFTRTSIFSGLNNLRDITMDEDNANICGIEIENLETYFSGHIEALASLDKFKGFASLHDEILAWYDGYSWDGSTRVINPFSLLSFFAQRRFSGFWYASGTPTFLIRMIKEKPTSYLEFKNLEMGEWELD